MAMAPDEALQLIRGYAAAGRIFLTPHARDRMRERGVQFRDVRHGLVNAVSCRWQDDRGTWRVTTADCGGDDLVMAVALEGQDVVVTVF